MRLNGRSVDGRLDFNVNCCLVSSTIASLHAPDSVLDRAVIQAEFRGTSFTADVPVDVDEIDCDVVVGREWVALFHLVVDDRPIAVRNFRDDVTPSHPEESLISTFPLPGSISTTFTADHDVHLGSVPSDNADRSDSVRLLEKALHSDELASCAWTIFHSDVDVLRRCCAMHGVVDADNGDYGHALLRHFFTGMCALAGEEDLHLACRDICRGLQSRADVITILVGSVLQPDVRYPTERLSMIARAIGLVVSGAGVERRKLVSMLEDFRSGCAVTHHEIVPEVLFSSIERVVRGSLLSLGFAHGILLSGDRDRMRNALILHVSQGDCAVHSSANHPGCLNVVRQYLTDLGLFDSDLLQIRILGAVCRSIGLLPLRRLLRLHNLSFDPRSSLAKLRRILRTYVDRLNRERGRLQCNVSHSRWPALISEQRKIEIVRGFREATSSEALKTFVCASCSAKRSRVDRVEVGLTDVDLELLKRPDRRLVDGEIIHARWIDSQCVGPTFETPHKVLQDVLVAREGVAESDGRVTALHFCGP